MVTGKGTTLSKQQFLGLVQPIFSDEEITLSRYRHARDESFDRAPAWLFEPFIDGTQLIRTCLEDGALIAARFNDRLLGAARLQRQRDHGGV
mgnify:CR=1 FL=1